jgi:23S rRNA pseudouridine2605 synthase
MPRDNDKHNAPRGRSPGGRGPGGKGGGGKPGGSKGRSGAARGPEKKFAKRANAGLPEGERRPYAGKRDDAAPARSYSERPKRDFSDRPKRDFSDRPKRDFSDRPKRDFSDRPKRDFSDRPARGDRPFKPREDRRDDARPASRFADKKFGEKRPYAPRGDSDRPQGGRPSFKPRGDRPEGDRPFKPRGDRPGFSRDDRGPRRDAGGPDRSNVKPWEKKPWEDKGRDDKGRESRGRDDRGREARGSRDERPARRDDRPARRDDRPRFDRAGGDRPKFDRPKFDRPQSDRPKFDRPRDDRSGGDERPRFSRPRQDRNDTERPSFDRPRGRSDWQEHPRNEGRDSERPRRDNEDDSRIFAKRPAFGGRGDYRERKPEDRKPPRPPAAKKPGERIAKIVARAGLCSRRDAEEWITQGRVAVNGRVINSPALDITSRDVVTIDGKPLPAPERTRLFMFHKPRGLMTTHADPEGRPTVFDNLPEGLPRLISIGRLDFNTEGLLLLTNDGGLARTLELPDTGWLRRYRVRAHGEVTQAQLDELRNGVEVDGVKYGSIDAQLERDKGANVWLVFAIREGKNREVRNVLAHLGLEVNRLIRVSYGPFQLGELGEGEVEEVKTRVLREQLGEKIASAAGADFARQLPSKGDVADDPVVTKKTPMKRSTVEDRKGRRVLVQRAGSDDARARNEDEANGYGPPKRPKRGYHGKRNLTPREE